MKITYLGTASGKPSRNRNVSSQFIEFNKLNVLVDCGEATQHQFLKTNIKINKIDVICVTHTHGDHIYGLPGLLSSMSVEERTKDVLIVCPEKLKSFINTALNITNTSLKFKINYLFIEELKDYKLNDEFTLNTLKLNHDINSYAFIFEENKSNICPNKLKELNIKPGPLLKELKENSVMIDDKLIHPEDVLIHTNNKYLICGDNNISKESELLDYLKNNKVKLLVHECTTLGLEGENNIDSHSNLNDIIERLNNISIENVILNHFSFRYSANDLKEIYEQIKDKINYNLYLANDLDIFEL